MSEQLVAEIPPPLVTWNLLQLDDESEPSSSQHIQVSRGPFRAFNLNNTEPEPSQAPSASEEAQHELNIQQNSGTEPQEVQVVSQNVDDRPRPSCPTHTTISWPRAIEEVEVDSDVPRADTQETPDSHSEQCQSLTELLDNNWLGTAQTIDATEWSDAVATEAVDVSDNLLSPSISLDIPAPFEPHQADMISGLGSNTTALSLISRVVEPDCVRGCCSSPLPTPCKIVRQVNSYIPCNAVFLLKHYKSIVLPCLTPFTHNKTPWHTLFIPNVNNYLAALTLGDGVDNASLCALFGTLAISASSIGNLFQSPQWLDRCKIYHDQARSYMAVTLEAAYHTRKAYKYKSVLMALLTMIQLSLMFRKQQEADFYFLETERLIRIKGLNRRKSRKVRLLHHCYTFERIQHESTLVLNRTSLFQRSRIRACVQASEAAQFSADSLSFRLGSWTDLPQAMFSIKEREKGENDLHLEHPGIWPDTLFPEIFGLSESHVFILSLLVRLAKEKDDTQQTPKTNTTVGRFFKVTKAVEAWICQLHLSDAGFGDEDLGGAVNIMPKIMQNALAIYFYRKVYDLDSNLLRQYVLNVLNYLLNLDKVDGCIGYASLRLIWPAFIAASESGEDTIRIAFCQWFENAAIRSGLEIFTSVRDRVNEIWAQRDNNANFEVII